MSLYPYPTDFPAPEVFGIVTDALRGKIDFKLSAHAVWQVAGYGMSQLDKPQPTNAFADQQEITTYHGAAAALEGHSVNPSQVVPWGIVLPILADLLVKILARR